MEGSSDLLSSEEIEKLCDCEECGLSGKCVYHGKYQRWPRRPNGMGGLGKCANLPENGGKLQY